MKKLLIVLLALTVVGALVFAEDAPAASISVGGWGRAFYDVVASNGTDSWVTAGPGWANNGARVGVSFNGNSENVGFNWNPGVSNNQMTPVCDIAKIWVKINPMVTVQVGKIQGDVLRGKIDDSGDVVATAGKDDIFKRFYPNTGLLLDITPVEGFYIGAAIDSADTVTSVTTYTVDPTGASPFAIDPATGIIDSYIVETTSVTTPTKASDAYKAIQIGAGYTIKDIGQFRAQYIGSAVDKGGVFNAAFAYTGMAGLVADLGAKFAMDSNKQTEIAAGATYGKDAISLYGIVAAFVGGGADFNLTGTAEAYYTVAAPISVGVEAALTGMNANKDLNAKVVDVFPCVKLGYSNGYLKVGFDAKVGLDGQDFGYQVPLQVEYWF
jgi:hypothetical protein